MGVVFIEVPQRGMRYMHARSSRTNQPTLLFPIMHNHIRCRQVDIDTRNLYGNP